MDDINQAIVLYTGWNSTAYPQEDSGRILDYFGGREGTALVDKVRLIIEDLQEIQPDWAKHDLVSASRSAVGNLASRHWILNNEARSALEWLYSWWWK